ncbi:hypothetical protein [Embleya sp. NPDC001921]
MARPVARRGDDGAADHPHLAASGRDTYSAHPRRVSAYDLIVDQ